MRRRILVVQNENQNGSAAAFTTPQMLEAAGFEVRALAGFTQVLKQALDFRPDLVLCFVSRWDQSLQELLWEMGSLNTTRSVRRIVLALHATADERALALDAGADDFLAQTISSRELLARVQSVLRSLRSVNQEERQSLGSLHLYREAMEVEIGDQRTRLSPREFGLLAYLISRPGRVIGRDELLENLWYPSGEIEDRRVVDVYIWRLREKIEENPSNPHRLITRRGEGYALVDPSRAEG